MKSPQMFDEERAMLAAWTNFKRTRVKQLSISELAQLARCSEDTIRALESVPHIDATGNTASSDYDAVLRVLEILDLPPEFALNLSDAVF